MKRNIEDILNSPYERDRVTIDKGVADKAISIGHNFEAVLADLEKRMRAAAADLEFETAARLRDEIKRLKQTEMAVFEEPTGRQSQVTAKAGKAAASQYGDAANSAPTRAAKPSLDTMGPGTDREVPLSAPRGRRAAAGLRPAAVSRSRQFSSRSSGCPRNLPAVEHAGDHPSSRKLIVSGCPSRCQRQSGGHCAYRHARPEITLTWSHGRAYQPLRPLQALLRGGCAAVPPVGGGGRHVAPAGEQPSRRPRH